MIEVVVRVDDVRERLVRPELARFREDGERPRVVLRRLDEYQMILELDDDAVMTLSGEQPDAHAGEQPCEAEREQAAREALLQRRAAEGADCGGNAEQRRVAVADVIAEGVCDDACERGDRDRAE